MRRKWLFGILLAILLIAVVSIGFAENTDTIIIESLPEEVPIGADISFAVTVSRPEGWIEWELYDPDTDWFDSREKEIESLTTLESSLSQKRMVARGMQPGIKLLTFTWFTYDPDWEANVFATVSREILLTGDPVVNPTLTVKNDSGEETREFYGEQTIMLSGSAGTADNIHLMIRPCYGDSYSYGDAIEKSAVPDQEGKWSCEVSYEELDHNTNCYNIYAEGYRNSLYNGKSDESVIFYYDDSSSIPMPGVTVNKRDEQQWTIEVSAPDQVSYDGAFFWILDEDGEKVFSYDLYFNESGIARDSFELSYIGNYLVKVVGCRKTDILDENNEYIGETYVYSEPAEESIEVEEGRHKPVNGKIPVMEIPQTIKAGEDLELHWVPCASDAYMDVTVFKNYWQIVYSDDEFASERIFKIRLPEEGVYIVRQSSNADYYEDTVSRTRLTVEQNDEQPAPPVPTLLDENVYISLPFHVSLGEGQEYEDVRCRLTARSEEDGASWDVDIDTVLDGDTVCVRNNDNYREEIEKSDETTLYIQVKKNGFWSKEVSLEIPFTEAPAVNEIMFVDFPETLQRGENLNVIALIPGDTGTLSFSLNINEVSFMDWTELQGNVFTHTWEADIFLDPYYQNGTCYVWLTWNGQTVREQFTLVGDCPEKPTIDSMPVNLQAGDSVTLTGQAGDAATIRVDSYWENEGKSSDFDLPVPIAEDGTWTYTMTNLKAGRYSVSVHGMDGKLSTGSSDIDFYVTGENSLPKPIVSAATDGYEITFTLEPGTGVTAEEIEWTVCRTDEHGERTSRWESADENGGCVIDQYVGPYTNTYTFTIVYCADGVYSEPEEYVWNVEGSPYPINGEIPVDLDVPETWEAGNDMALSWTPVVEGQHLEINLYKAFTDEWLWGDSEDASSVEEITFVIDGNLLDDGQYLIRLNSDADTYESVNKKYYFTVIDNRPEGPEITLSADKIKVGEYVYATVTLPEDREEILAVQTGMNMYQYHVRNGSIIPIEQESLGVYTYRFRLKTENGWTKPTEKIITVELAGKIPRVDYKTLVTWPARITAGQDVTITVKKITGVDHYSVSVYGNGFRHNENFDGTQVTIPGVLFEAGDNIQIRVYAYVKGLYEAIGDGEECAAKAYTVAGSASLADPITISAENTTVYVNGYTKIFLDRPAEKIILMTKEPGLDIWKTTGRWFDGSWEEVEVSFWTDGPAQVRLTAFINGKWTQWSNELSFMVNPVIGLLECPEVTAAQAGNCLHVSWSAVDHAESYYIQVYMTTSHKWYSWWIQNGATEHSIPVSKIGEGSGYVFVLSEGTGYESDYSNQRRALFTVKALKIPDDGVHTPEALTVIEAEAFAGIDAKKIIIPETCTEIRSRAFADIETLEEVWILGMNTVVAGDAFEECGNVVIMTPEGSKAEGILDGKPNITIEHIP